MISLVYGVVFGYEVREYRDGGRAPQAPGETSPGSGTHDGRLSYDFILERIIRVLDGGN